MGKSSQNEIKATRKLSKETFVDRCSDIFHTRGRLDG